MFFRFDKLLTRSKFNRQQLATTMTTHISTIKFPIAIAMQSLERMQYFPEPNQISTAN